RSINCAEIKGEHGAGAALLLARDFVLRVRGKTGVKDFADFGMGVEMACDGDAVDVVLQHADGKGLEPARNQEAVHRSKACTRGALQEVNLLGIFGPREHDGAAGGVAVAVEVFRHGVNNDVRTEFDGSLQVRAEECVIDDEGDVSLVGELGHGSDIGNAHGGVRGRLDVQHFRVGAAGGDDGFVDGRIDKAEFKTEVHEKLRRKAEDTAVHSF